jgi:hypothetical protein
MLAQCAQFAPQFAVMASGHAAELEKKSRQNGLPTGSCRKMLLK